MTTSSSQRTKSLQPMFNFTVKEMNSWVEILSVFNDKLMISNKGLSNLFIYVIHNQEYTFGSTIKIPDNDQLSSAEWTPRGNIVYTTSNSKKVVVMEASGKIKSSKQMADPRCLSVSHDNTIYLADHRQGIYKSTDDVITWNFVFNSSDVWGFWQAIKVTSDTVDNYWTTGKINGTWRLRIYSVDRAHADGRPTPWRDINCCTAYGNSVDLTWSIMAHDGMAYIFLSDYKNQAIHAWTVNGRYYGS